MTAPTTPQPNHTYKDYTPVSFTCFDGSKETIYLPANICETEVKEDNYLIKFLQAIKDITE